MKIEKIKIHTDKIYCSHKTIKDPEKIASIIKNHISHLGEFDIYYKKIWWRKLKK